MIKLEVKVDDKQFQNFVGVEIYKSIEHLTHTFTLQYKSFLNDNIVPPIIYAGSKIEIIVDGKTILIGYADKGINNNINLESNTHDITVSGTDIFGSILDSRLRTSITLKSPLDIRTAIGKVLKELNYEKVQLSIEQGVNTIISTDQDISGNVGINAYVYISQFLERKRMLLCSDGVNTLQLSQNPGKVIENFALQCNSGAKSAKNNCISIQRKTGVSLPYQLTEVIGYVDIKKLKNQKKKQQAQSHIHPVISSTAIPYRKNVISLKHSISQTDLEELAVFLADNYHRYQDTISVVVPTWYAGDEIFAINTLVHLSSNYCKINDFLVIQDVRLLYNSQERQYQAELSLIFPKASDAILSLLDQLQ